ncbi:GntT/GntP/DsdX family permease [Testudinibacter sp. TR-2022]|uniref:GntT/GntP/DsdX family permease n=1 Tax=Testudinibacter sp. TR-2022 TaxID=2585029 RepID=UPI00111B4945|nr:gluconate:H+ symporter [Testudinibacter sp. TR-2022]TNH09349.1 GntT protein [Pasteurellaceae bacterium Phil11]TNH25079.1 GntT protein [Testudinibacter sp. TR-2022]TNH29375.1 GntT protein [Testudinibacter sp. TR-2022]
MSNEMLILIGIASVLALLFIMIKGKVHPFLALGVVSIAVALTAGIPMNKVMPTLISGMGSTLGGVALIVGLGAMLGKIIEKSNGADVMANWLLDKFGEKRAAFALGLTGFIFGIPVFVDVGFIVLIPIIFSVARRLGGNMLVYTLPIGLSMLTVHVFLPPHPGIVAGAQVLNADIGLVLGVGFLAALPAYLLGQLFIPFFTNRNFVKVSTSSDLIQQQKEQSYSTDGLPSFGLVLMMIVTPLILIMLGTVTATTLPKENIIREIFSMVGSSPFALMFAVFLSSYTLGIRRGWRKEQLEEILNSSLAPIAGIILITGAGGMFGKVLDASGVGKALADVLSATGLPILLLAFILAALLRAAQGSATVATITTATILAPAIIAEQYSGLQIALVTSAIAAGSMTLSHVNDSLFWVWTKFFGISVSQGLKTWTILTTIFGLIGFLAVSLMWMIFV